MNALALATLLISLMAITTEAAIITLGVGQGRKATLSSAISGVAVPLGKTAKEGDILDAFSGAAWKDIGHVDSPGLSDGILTISFTSGGFGSTPSSGNWTVNPSFLSSYSELAFSIHAGGGKNKLAPDNFIWKVDLNDGLSGTWSIMNESGTNGGGFSNFIAYGRGKPSDIPPPRDVPDGGTTLASLGLALLGLGSMRRFLIKKA